MWPVSNQKWFIASTANEGSALWLPITYWSNWEKTLPLFHNKYVAETEMKWKKQVFLGINDQISVVVVCVIARVAGQKKAFKTAEGDWAGTPVSLPVPKPSVWFHKSCPQLCVGEFLCRVFIMICKWAQHCIAWRTGGTGQKGTGAERDRWMEDAEREDCEGRTDRERWQQRRRKRRAKRRARLSEQRREE